MPALIGFFGKTPRQGDFIRHNTGASIAAPFMSWLTKGAEILGQAKEGLPSSPVGFLYAAPSHAEVLVGAFISSSDSVGRAFPLAAFTTVDTKSIAQQYSAVPRAYDAFLDDAVSVLTSAAGHDQQSLAELTDRLVPPPVSDLLALHNACRSELDTWTMAAFQSELGDQAGQHYYALHALLSACRPLRGKAPASSGIVTLECPIVSPTMCTGWLELAMSALQWPVPPSFFWTSGEPRHLLLSLGEPPAAVLNYIAGGDPNAAKKWPLQTKSATAIAGARDKLSPEMRQAIDTLGGSFAQVLSAVKH